ncbi:MAG: hypothetical protein GF388_11235 [Candidatus Aegiribacteria sp.]|nr:hypothetical protein [Candidatus Aegiribacteria sp.]MBD3295569.1 hypothetical protein [Candidatus Fermentibacteria bacterium]
MYTCPDELSCNLRRIRESEGMTENSKSMWNAPKGFRLPDFMICGAMKCGTSTVHTLLNKHPSVFIPNPEINFFDIDDLLQHPDFVFRQGDEWKWPDISKAPDSFWKWYGSFFDSAPNDSLWGEDSTTYLTSSRASYRLSLQSAPVKTIICLRQPSLRAYSQYWHMLRTGRAMFSFENTIRYTPHYVLERSMYLNQLREFMRHIPRDRIFFFVLEKYLSDKEQTLKELANFLSIRYDLFPEDVLETHSNVATFPRSIRLQILKNRITRSYGNRHYLKRIPFAESIADNSTPFFSRLINSLHNRLNKLEEGSAPSMDSTTRSFLDSYFRQELKGLDELVETDLESLWFSE